MDTGCRENPLHGGGHGSGIRDGDAGDGGPRAAQIPSERAGVRACLNGGGQVGGALRPVRLVQPVGQRTAEKVVSPAGERGGDQRGVGRVPHGVRVRNVAWQVHAGGIGLNLVGRDEDDKAHLGSDLAAEEDPVRARRGESAEGRGCRIVGVSLETGAEPVKGDAFERTSGEMVESVQDPEPDNDTAAEAAGPGHRPLDVPSEIEKRGARGLEERRRRGICHGMRRAGASASDGDTAVEIQGHAEAIEAGAQVGTGRGNANGHLIHKEVQSG